MRTIQKWKMKHERFEKWMIEIVWILKHDNIMSMIELQKMIFQSFNDWFLSLSMIEMFHLLFSFFLNNNDIRYNIIKNAKLKIKNIKQWKLKNWFNNKSGKIKIDSGTRGSQPPGPLGGRSPPPGPLGGRPLCSCKHMCYVWWGRLPRSNPILSKNKYNMVSSSKYKVPYVCA